MADMVKQITGAMDMLADDSSVPRNIRKGAADAKARLLNMNDALDVRCSGAMNILDDLANDPNIPMHARSMIWQILSQLELLNKN